MNAFLALFLAITFPVGVLAHMMAGNSVGESILETANVIRRAWRGEW